jgi:hypothetical protein
MDDPMKADTETPKTTQWNWKNLRWGHVGNLFGIIGVPLSLVICLASVRDPDVTYTINPVRVAVARSGISSDLAFLYKGAEVKSNVTSVSVEIWNAGPKSPTQIHPFQSAPSRGQVIAWSLNDAYRTSDLRAARGAFAAALSSKYCRTS